MNRFSDGTREDRPLAEPNANSCKVGDAFVQGGPAFHSKRLHDLRLGGLPGLGGCVRHPLTLGGQADEFRSSLAGSRHDDPSGADERAKSAIQGSVVHDQILGQSTERGAGVPGPLDRPQDGELGDINPGGGQGFVIDPADGAGRLAQGGAGAGEIDRSWHIMHMHNVYALNKGCNRRVSIAGSAPPPEAGQVLQSVTISRIWEPAIARSYCSQVANDSLQQEG